MIVVSDTSPLTALLTIGRAELLHLLFGQVIIPPAVAAELLHDHPVLPAWIEVLSPSHIPPAVIAARAYASKSLQIVDNQRSVFSFRRN